MRILLLILSCLFLTGCRASSAIYYNLYIASIGFEHTDTGYTGHFFLPSSMDVGNTNQDASDKSSEVAVVEGDSISSVFYNLELSSTLNINLKHISSIVLHESMLNDEDLRDFIKYIKESKGFDYNFYIFTATDKVEDIYKLKNPNQESVILTMLVEPKVSSYAFIAAAPIHFLNFCRDYLNDKVIPLPLIDVEKIWSEEKDSTYCRGVTFLSKGKGYSYSYDVEQFEFLKSNINLEYSDEVISIIMDTYDIRYKYNKLGVEIAVSVKYRSFYSKLENDSDEYIKNVIINKISSLIKDYQQEIDFLNFEYYGCTDSQVTYKVNVKQQI